MLGQGSPITTLRALRSSLRPDGDGGDVRWGIESALAEAIEARLRFAWGSSAPARKSGPVRLPSPMANSPTSSPSASKLMKRLRSGSAIVRSSSRRWPAAQFDGFDVTIRADETAKVTIDLRGLPNAPAKPIEFTLAELTQKLQRAPLDDLGGFLIVQRTPGDSLRVEFNRAALSSSAPEESFPLTVHPQLGDDGGGTRDARGETLPTQLVPTSSGRRRPSTIPKPTLRCRLN